MKTLRDIPAVRALAEKQARDIHNATVRVIRERYPNHYGQSLLDALPPMWADVDAQLDLLWDLERPASRDAIARLIAEVIGWDAFDVTKAVESSAEMLAGLYRVAGLPELPRWEPVPPPAEALRLIAIAVLGGSRG